MIVNANPIAIYDRSLVWWFSLNYDPYRVVIFLQTSAAGALTLAARNVASEQTASVSDSICPKSALTCPQHLCPNLLTTTAQGKPVSRSVDSLLPERTFMIPGRRDTEATLIRQVRASTRQARPLFLHVFLANWLITMDMAKNIAAGLSPGYVAVRPDQLVDLYGQSKGLDSQNHSPRSSARRGTFISGAPLYNPAECRPIRGGGQAGFSAAGCTKARYNPLHAKSAGMSSKRSRRKKSD